MSSQTHSKNQEQDRGTPGSERGSSAVRRLGWIYRAAAILVVLAGLGWVGRSWLGQAIEFNVAPFATTHFNGKERYVNPRAALTRAALEVVTDGTVDTLYTAELPVSANGAELTISLPWPMQIVRLEVLGVESSTTGEIEIEFRAADGSWNSMGTNSWSGGTQPPLVEAFDPIELSELRLRFRRMNPVLLNAVALYVLAPRWLAWGAFLALMLLLPLACGTFVLLVILGWGRLACPGRDANMDGLGRQLVAGVLILALAGTAWLLAKDWPPASTAYWLFLSFGALAQGCRLARRRWQQLPADAAPFWPLLLGTLLLLVMEVMTDTNLVLFRRMQPVDYLLAYLGAERLVLSAPMTEGLVSRPWLVHVQFAPWLVALGRFSYWGYIGFIAGINVLILVPMGLWARRWGWNERAVALVALMPVLPVFNALGQRPFAAALCLYSLFEYRAPKARCAWLWGGLSLAAAIGAHPGSLFLVPGILLFGWLAPSANGGTDSWQRRLGRTLNFLAIPLGAWIAWTISVQRFVASTGNELLLYPVLVDPSAYNPAEGIWAYLRRQGPEYWRQLVWNRFVHFRQYLWAENLSHPLVDCFRWVSLTSTLGFVLALSLWRRALWTVDWPFVLLAIVAPLAVHHLHLGQAGAQFHISPTPFFGIAFLAAGWLVGGTIDSARGRTGLLAAVLIEFGVRRAYPLALTLCASHVRGEPPMDSMGMFGLEFWSYPVLAALLPFLWAVAAWQWLIAKPRPESAAPPAPLDRSHPSC